MMASISYFPGCTYIRGSDRDEVLRMAECYARRGFEIFGSKTYNKGIGQKPKYYEAILVPM